MGTTKKDLINRITEATNTTHTSTKAVVQQFFDEAIGELAKDNSLKFRHFGVFDTKITPTGTGKNARTLRESMCQPSTRRCSR